MEFKLNEEQLEIKRAVREFCEKEFTPELALEFDQKEEFPFSLYKKSSTIRLHEHAHTTRIRRTRLRRT